MWGFLNHLTGAGETGDVRPGLDPRVRLEFYGSKISSEGGLLLFRELDAVLGLTILRAVFCETPAQITIDCIPWSAGFRSVGRI